MKIKALLLIIILAVSAAYANAKDETKNYVIIKGDTLWDISDSELNEPMLWPRLWHVNPQIENPDLIFPGTRVWVPSKEELMRMTKDMPLPDVMEAPEELALDFPEYMPTVTAPPEPPVDYLVNKRTFLSSGWVSNDYSAIGHITYTDRGRNLFGTSDTVFLETNKDVSVGDMFLTLRKLKNVKHPKYGNKVGSQVRITGLIKVVGMENNTPKAKVIETFDHIDDGDELLCYNGTKPPVKPETARTPDISGYIIGSRSDDYMSTVGEIVYLDKGSDDGLQVADIFSIQDNAPSGTLQVISTKPHTAAAIILTVRQEVVAGDTWGKK